MPNRNRRDGASERGPITVARRFRPRLLPTLITLVAAAVFVMAGNWQRGRMHAKEALFARYEAAMSLPPATLSEAEAAGDWPGLRFRRVVARGEYDPGHQILVDNKVRAGRAGYHVVTPLRLGDGRAVLVDRGWTPAGPTRANLPDVPPPLGVVEVQGRLNLPPERYFELRTETSPGALWQNLDIARFTKATGVAVLPAIIEQTEAPVPAEALMRDWPAPDSGVDQHRIYMVQWYAYAALAVALWAVLNLRVRREATP